MVDERQQLSRSRRFGGVLTCTHVLETRYLGNGPVATFSISARSFSLTLSLTDICMVYYFKLGYEYYDELAIYALYEPGATVSIVQKASVTCRTRARAQAAQPPYRLRFRVFNIRVLYTRPT